MGRFAGIDVRVHWTFMLLPLWVYFSNLASGSGALAATGSVLMVLCVFACVLLHEFGHALTARRFGIPTRDITLLPIGGVASLQRMPREPWKELAIAVAGPAVNVVIASVIFATLWLLSPLSGTVAAFLYQLAIINVALVVFNMLPAFPMDGGRVLRSILAMRLPYLRATVIAARVGQLTAATFGLLGLIGGNLLLVFVAGFIILAAQGESLRARMETAGERPTPESQASNSWNSPFTPPSDQASSTHPSYTDSYAEHDSSQRVRDRLLREAAGQRSPSTPPPSHEQHAHERSMPVISAQWNSKSALGWLGSDSLDDFLVSSGGSVIGVLRKSDLRHAVKNGRGAVTIDRLVASGTFRLRPIA
ncbi:Peptidase M50 [Rhodopirellula sallentina SM41]|uniref:Zinc metalloprotease n=1 Tax=Rhodopirellula sallentina SM41 TaxID=1263870 RepID=M5UCF1_9BACT|nr:Peptidase M50 [Rhodopirellula sallentina SM41]